MALAAAFLVLVRSFIWKSLILRFDDGLGIAIFNTARSTGMVEGSPIFPRASILFWYLKFLLPGVFLGPQTKVV